MIIILYSYSFYLFSPKFSKKYHIITIFLSNFAVNARKSFKGIEYSLKEIIKADKSKYSKQRRVLFI